MVDGGSFLNTPHTENRIFRLGPHLGPHLGQRLGPRLGPPIGNFGPPSGVHLQNFGPPTGVDRNLFRSTPKIRSTPEIPVHIWAHV